MDPLAKEFPWYTPYQFAGNKPIIAIDLDGLEEKVIVGEVGKKTGTEVVKRTSVEIGKMTWDDAMKMVNGSSRVGGRIIGATFGTILNLFIPADAGESAQFASLLNYEKHRFTELTNKPYTQLSESEKIELNHYYGKYEIGKDGSINPQPIASGINQEPPGIIYLRTDNEGILKPYVGQTKSEERYEARQREHDRSYPDSDFEYTIIDRGYPGQDLNQREQRALEDRNGPTNNSHPNGGTSNKRNVIRNK